MKRLFVVILSIALLISGCAQESTNSSGSTNTSSADKQTTESKKQKKSATEDGSDAKDLAAGTDDSDKIEDFHSLSDPRLLQYIEDTVYTGLVDEYQSEDYIIENVKAVYVSEDYLEEKAYNSKSNIFFGYTLEELDKQFKGTPYVFTLGDDGNTEVVPFEDYDDTYEQVIKNVAVGTGVILICVTVSVATGGAGAAPVSMIFTVAAKSGTTVALSSGAFSAVFAGAITGIKTKDFNKALKAAALEGSKGFKWGAITGTIAGGASEASALRQATKVAKNGKVIIDEKAPAWRQAEQRSQQIYGGDEQVTYLNGDEVPFGTPDATRPDIVRPVDDHLEAIEVKYYDLESSRSRSTLYRELEREVEDRTINMPRGTTQRVVLDVTNRNFSPELIQEVSTTIETRLSTIYPDIPIDIVGG